MALPSAASAQLAKFFDGVKASWQAMSEPEKVFGADKKFTSGVVLDWDNDNYQLRGTDRDYTNGTRLTFQRSGSEPGAAKVYGMHAGQNMYTPSDIGLFPDQIDRRDHPYGAWLYAGVWAEEHYATGKSVRYELNVGCIGPCAQGEEVQKFIHKIVNSKTPRGWDLQVKNELGILARVEHAWTYSIVDGAMELSPRAGADLGNVFFQGFGGGSLRLGLLRPFYCGATGTKPIAPYAPPVRDAMLIAYPAKEEKQKHCETELSKQRQLYAFLDAEGKLVGYNALLEGPMFSNGSPHTVDPRRFVLDTEIGAAWQYGNFSLRYAIAMRSTEVEAQPFDWNRYRFGRIQVGVAW